MAAYEFAPYAFVRLPPEEMQRRSQAHLETMRGRRSAREFAPDPIAPEILRTVVAAAAQAPSGANKQPWTFVVVTDNHLKEQIRSEAETEERQTYDHRMSDEWRQALAPLGTDWRKPFLTTAPALIVMFRRDYETLPNGERRKNYYVQESCGIALGFLITALHLAGLATLTHTPSPMGFLARILGRPANERPYMLLPVGFPHPACRVPEIRRRPLSETLVEL